MKKLLTLTGVITLAAVISSSAYAGVNQTAVSTGTTQQHSYVAASLHDTTMPAGQIEHNSLMGNNYSDYGYHRSRHNGNGYRGYHSSGRRGWGGCGW